MLATVAANLPGAGNQDAGNDTAMAATIVDAPPAARAALRVVSWPATSRSLSI